MKAFAPTALSVMFGLGIASSAATASLVVDFDTDTNGSGSLATRTVFPNLDLSGNGDDDDSRVARAFTDVGRTPWSTGASYTGPTLYGGLVGESLGISNRNIAGYALTPFDVRYQTTGDGETGRLHMVLLFEANQTGLTFDTGPGGTSSMVLSGDNGGSINRFDALGEVRWVVRNGSDIFVSESLISNTVGGRVLDAEELADEMWAVYDPADGFAFNLTLNFDTPTSALTNMNAFGVMTYKEDFTPSRHWFQFREFKVSAIPEPASLALLAVGGMLLAGRRRG